MVAANIFLRMTSNKGKHRRTSLTLPQFTGVGLATFLRSYSDSDHYPI